MTPSKIDTLEEHEVEAEMEVHPAITLLIARMETHPKEFYRYAPNQSSPLNTNPNNNKVMQALSQTLEHTKSLWNRKEKRLYNIALRKVRMEEAHERLMRTLLEGTK